ncbi:UvrD-helicase domain-containing protein [Glutamicibacter ardleyensis]|uniref:UvrD-helicase domain-containing protein n=1 Tax=Glutamicibacter ardleyensis TaxID=225894 RepID=UPI003FD08623
MSINLQLDSSQLNVINSDAETRQFVVAAAGQGKTEVLVSRMLNLEKQGLNPADEILVLSFSRAAVEAVRSRANFAGIRNVGILTFDAFAARLINDEGEDPEPGFDQRIRQATELLHREDIPQIVEPLRHLLVDEAQDLVGDRAEMVTALLAALDSDTGFTILGDPLQGIYDFQLEESEAKTTSIELMNKIVFGFGAEKVALEKHYRAATKAMKELIPLADQIRALETSERNAAAAHALLDGFIPGQIGASFLSEAGALEPLDGDTTALLVSTNFEVLLASELLWEKDIEHVVRRRAQDMSLAPWIYHVFGKMPARSYSFDEVFNRLSTVESINPNEAWRHLKRVEGKLSLPGQLDMVRLTRRLGSQSIPIALTVDDSHRLVISTVHHAKGLEFSNVIYLAPEIGSPAAECTWATLRQKYVAVSRAREQVITSSFPRSTTVLNRSLPHSKNAVELRFKGKGKPVPVRMEFGNGDIDDVAPYTNFDFTAARIIAELERPDLIGLSITGVLDSDSGQDGDVARYILLTPEGTPVGRTSVGFAYALKKTFCWPGSKSWIWPPKFEGARVTSLETATGNPEETAAAGLLASGLWLVPRLTGLIRPLWK